MESPRNGRWPNPLPSSQAVLFQARDLMHATPSWSLFDRIVLVAYTTAGWERFSEAMRTDLQQVGFRLPETSTRLPEPILPPVLR